MRPSKPSVEIAILVAVFLVGSSCSRSEPPTPSEARATLIDAEGDEVAHASFAETEAGVEIHLAVDGLPPGDYRAQIHEVGVCKPPDFLSAGEPFPPPEELAMVESVAQPLDRYIAQFHVSNGGKQVKAVAPIVTLRPGDNSLFHPGGTSLVIDNLSPTGTYEGRVACGVITGPSEQAVEDLTPGDLESARHPDQTGIPGKEYQQPEQPQIEP